MITDGIRIFEIFHDSFKLFLQFKSSEIFLRFFCDFRKFWSISGLLENFMKFLKGNTYPIHKNTMFLIFDSTLIKGMHGPFLYNL